MLWPAGLNHLPRLPLEISRGSNNAHIRKLQKDPESFPISDETATLRLHDETQSGSD